MKLLLENWREYVAQEDSEQSETIEKLLRMGFNQAISLINALKTRAGLKIYSLRNKRLATLLEQEQEKFKKQSAREIQEVDYKDTSSSKPMRPYGKKSQISKLRDE